jgi:glucose/arabinose dehydrogenase
MTAHRTVARVLAPVPVLAALFVLLAPPAEGATTLSVTQVATGISRPVWVGSPPGDPRLFVVEQRGIDNRGRIKIVKNGALLPTPFLVTAPLATGNEQGLLGLAFAPDFATSGVFYINYNTTSGGTTRIARHRVSTGNPDRADSVGEVFLSIAQPFSNHNGGWLGFGPDGYLYIPMGDGGDGGDPGDRAQDLGTMLGKVLRIDVSGPTGYTVPPDNPYVGQGGALPEIWAIGLRNPYRCSFDRETHDFIIADVGQVAWEEVNFAPAPNLGRKANYGWRCWEGNHPYTTSSTTPCSSCSDTGCFHFPAYEYGHTLGRCSVTGGSVYRGCLIPDLRGTYFFSDYCGAQIYTGRFDASGALTGVVDRNAELVAGTPYTLNSIVAFGEDAQGEMYLCDLGGQVYRIIPRTGVAETDLPSLRVSTAAGDTLGATGSGNALLPGVTAFADPGSRIAGAGFLRQATLRGCEVRAGNCLTVPLRRGVWDIDVETCVDPDSATLSRRFVFTNNSASPQPLDFRDVIAPWLGGDDDRAATFEPAAGGESGLLVLFDAATPDLYVRHRGFASGATITQDVDTKSAVETRVAADAALAGGVEAGPGRLALALGFNFGPVAPAAAETVLVVTRVTPTAPLGVEPIPPVAGGRLLELVGAMPFGPALSFALDLPAAGEAGLAIYDGRGRRVRVVHDGRLEAGRRTFTWDGRDERGAEMPAGLYFVRATTAHGNATLRAVRVR